MTAVERLKRAQERIIDVGWFQGDYIETPSSDRDNSKCRVCSLGALENWHWGEGYDSGLLKYDLAFSYSDIREAQDFLEQAMREIEVIDLGPISNRFIPAWNDKPGRTVEEVIRAFDRAIELAVEQESNE
jgi:hypothetical protein